VVLCGVRDVRDYLDRCGAVEGHLLLFDRRPKVPWRKKVFRRKVPARGRGPRVTVWGM
jgi:hypothetical protein